ncbi:VOC family protein [Micromonospora sp. NPDC050695]|uniref:VOC family protein n=1 Tax=Micromonospora sp. NPDC050695 TaxID=3154938 RepID=UPI0033CC363C
MEADTHVGTGHAETVTARFKDLCLDAADPLALGGFWARMLDADVADAGEGDTRVDPRSARSDAESIWVNRVPEPRVGKTRVHLDLRLPDAGPAALLAEGARLITEPSGEVTWWVLADPEGNEFCAFAPRRVNDRLPSAGGVD